MTIRQLDEWTLIGGQIHPDEVAGLAQMGVSLIVNHRPDGEEPGQPLGAQIEDAASAAGIDYRAVRRPSLPQGASARSWSAACSAAC